jgi:PAS domain S-box-containing protein
MKSDDGAQSGQSKPTEDLTEQEAAASLERLARIALGEFALLSTLDISHGMSVKDCGGDAGEPMDDGMYRRLLEQLPVVTFMARLGADSNEIYVSPQIEALLGFSQQEWLDDPVLWYERLHPEDQARWNAEFSHFLVLDEPFRSVYRFIARDGRIVWVHGEVTMVRDANGRPIIVQGIGYDVTELKEAQEGVKRAHDELEQRVQERTAELARANAALQAEIMERKKAQDALTRNQANIEALNVRLQRAMRETHHRVKNNLQIVTALVNMQQMQYDDFIPTTEMRRLTQHITALASIHDLLTHQAQTDAEVTDISVQAVMAKLMPTLQGMIEGRRITFEVQDLRLPVQQSTTFAVLVNELVSNALKHGTGAIHVSFRKHGETATLKVLDEGPGFPEGFDPISAANTGLDLIGSLSRMDLHGSVSYDNRAEGGASIVIEFPVATSAQTLERPISDAECKSANASAEP